MKRFLKSAFLMTVVTSLVPHTCEAARVYVTGGIYVTPLSPYCYPSPYYSPYYFPATYYALPPTFLQPVHVLTPTPTKQNVVINAPTTAVHQTYVTPAPTAISKLPLLAPQESTSGTTTTVIHH